MTRTSQNGRSQRASLLTSVAECWSLWAPDKEVPGSIFRSFIYNLTFKRTVTFYMFNFRTFRLWVSLIHTRRSISHYKNKQKSHGIWSGTLGVQGTAPPPPKPIHWSSNSLVSFLPILLAAGYLRARDVCNVNWPWSRMSEHGCTYFYILAGVILRVIMLFVIS